MYSAKFKVLRLRMINEMKLNIESIEPVGLHITVVSIVMFPALVALLVRNALVILWSSFKGLARVALEIIITPIAALYAFIDLSLISVWYISQINAKLSRKR